MTQTPQVLQVPDVIPRRSRARPARAVDTAGPAPTPAAAFAEPPHAPPATPPATPPEASQPAPQPAQETLGALGYVNVRRTAYGQEVESQETVRVPLVHPHPARVRVAGSVTRNLGDYNSARVEVSVDLPVLPELSEVERAYGVISTLVDDMIRRELALATGEDLSGVATPVDPNAAFAQYPGSFPTQ